ncbi:amidohydrolase [Endozoicomonas sp.]|nr:amidohydrolase [Endozoicomonas sp.]
MSILRQLVKLSLLVFALTLIACISTWHYLNPSPDAQQVFLNGTILTMNDRNEIAEAVLVEDGRILSVGSESEILALSDFNASTIDLEGKTLMPGFIEAHGHFPESGLKAIAVDLNSPPIGETLSIKDVAQKLTEQAKETPTGEWVIGFGYDHNRILERRYLTKTELTNIAPEHPVFIMHISGQVSMVNNLALEKLGLEKSEAGIFRGKAHTAARANVLDLSAGRLLSLLQYAVADYTVQGITTVQSGLTTPQTYLPLTLFASIGLIPQRLVIWPNAPLAEALHNEERIRIENEKVKIGAVKLVVDGAISNYAGYLTTPYFQQPPQKAGSYKGYQHLSDKNLKQLVKLWHDKGWQLALHASGDAAIDNVLNALDNALSSNPRDDSRHILVHSQMARVDQLEEMAELAITPSFFPSQIYYWGSQYKSRFLGSPRTEQSSPLQSALESGLRFSIHTDTPVIPAEPFPMIYHATSRKTLSGDVLGEDEKISVMDAIRATTIDAAWQVFMDDEIGSIESGKLADLIVVSENPLTAGERLPDITIEQTWMGGVLRYDRQGF